jgi:hypothetical protein
MKTNVVDTNVILVANSAHAEVSEECVIACVLRLRELMKSGALVLDDNYRILREYQNKTTPRKGKGVGDLFVKWALSNIANAVRVHQVMLTETTPDKYLEFPDSALEVSFDRSDRVFAATAHAHHQKPAILQAADCKWLDWWVPLSSYGVKVDFLCGSDVCKVYAKKFPRKAAPTLPT